MSEAEASGQPSMRRQMTHLETDVLAEFRAGLITGRRGTKIAAHLADCDRCTALDDQLAGVSTLLASVPAPPMPDSVAQRLDTVLAAEVTRKNYPERGGLDRPGETSARDRPARTRGFRLATWRVLVPVAAAVVLAAGGFGLSQMGGSTASQSAASSAGTALSSAAGSAAPAAGRANPPAAAPLFPAPSAHSQLKRQVVSLSPATLRQSVEAELQRPPASRPTKASSSQLLGCLRHLAGGAPLELVESIQFSGQPATIIVARTGQDDTVWVAGPDCSATTRDVLDTITVPPGISAP
jgi:hypothetical protein